MRRSLVALLAVLGAVLVYTLVILPLADKQREIREELQIKAETLGKYRVFLDSAGEMAEESERVEGELGRFGGRLIDVENDAMGFARLNSHIQAIIRKSGMEVISIKPLNVVKYKLYVGMPVQINATADIKQVKDFMLGLSAGKYLIAVDNVDIRVMNVRKPDKLRMKIEVSGYRKI